MAEGAAVTPYEIDILLHYYCRGGDHPSMERNPPMWRPTIDQFQADHLIRTIPQETRAQMAHPCCYEILDRGRIYCEKLIATPLPLPTWGYS